MQFQDKVVFVSGANRGIGKALVEALLKRGVKKVYATARQLSQLPNFNDTRVVPIQLDITNAQQIEAATRDAADTEILINNAGIAEFVNALTAEMATVEKEMNVNYYGTLAMMRAFLPILEAKPAGTTAMANLTSIASFVNFPFLSSYCASKAALFSITQGARIDLAPKGIAVFSVNPGPIDTDMGKALEMEKTSPEETAEGILNGMEANEPDIFPDPHGRGMFSIWKEDYRKLEAVVADMVKPTATAGV